MKLTWHIIKGRFMALTKIELAEKICGEIGLTKKEGITIVDSLLEIMKDEWASGNQVMISGFGKWTLKAKKERKGRNPQTGIEMTIAARKVISFKPPAVLRKVLEKWFKGIIFIIRSMGDYHASLSCATWWSLFRGRWSGPFFNGSRKGNGWRYGSTGYRIQDSGLIKMPIDSWIPYKLKAQESAFLST
jgi:integration host factor subunit alpha